jgi:hypothetical protein
MRLLPALFWCAATAVLLAGTDAQAQQRAAYEKLVATHAKANDVPEALVHRVIVRESKYRPDLVGRGGTIGLMQIKLATARGLGYKGDAEGLRDPETNLTYGVKYLAGAWRAANSDHARAMHYYASGYYYAAKRQRLKQPEPVLASAPPKDDVKPDESAVPQSAEAAEAPTETVAEPKEVEKPVQAATPLDIRPKQIATRPKHPKKLAEAKVPVPRPPAGISGSTNAAKPR